MMAEARHKEMRYKPAVSLEQLYNIIGFSSKQHSNYVGANFSKSCHAGPAHSNFSIRSIM